MSIAIHPFPLRGEAAEAASPADGGVRDGRILVVDDDADRRAALVRLLGRVWEVDQVADGHAAVHVVHEHGADLVLSRLSMPGMDGTEVVTALRADPATREVPVILVSDPEEGGPRVEAAAARADDYLMTPFTTRELVARVSGVMKLAEVRQGARADLLPYRTLFESIEDGFCVCEIIVDDSGDPIDFRYLEVNPAFGAMSGLQGDVVGRTVRELLPDLEDTWIETYGRVALTGEGARFERHAAALGRWFDVHAWPLELGHFGVLFRDITDRRQAEADRAAAARLASYRAALGDALRLVSDPFQLQARATRLLGEYLGASRVRYRDADPGEEQLEVVRDYTSGVRPITGRLRLADFGQSLVDRLKAGETIVVRDMTVAPSFTNAERAAFAQAEIGALVGVPLIRDGSYAAGLAVHQRTARDWTAEEVEVVEETASRIWTAVERAQAEASLRRSEDTLRETNEQLQLALAVKDEFLGLVSHELRTPLTVILGMSKVLERIGMSDVRARELAGDVAESAEVLSGLVESMLLLAHLDREEADLQREPVLLYRAAAHVLEERRRRDFKRPYELQVLSAAAVVSAQPQWLERVIDNFVSNAGKYSTPGERVDVIVDVADREARLRVIDRGPGLSPEEMARVFEPFYRSPAARERAAGAGLGLAISKRLIELMGGRIWVRAADDDGSEFGFALPVLIETEL